MFRHTATDLQIDHILYTSKERNSVHGVLIKDISQGRTCVRWDLSLSLPQALIVLTFLGLANSARSKNAGET